jgi:hypothetical protein
MAEPTPRQDPLASSHERPERATATVYLVGLRVRLLVGARS